MHGQPGLLGEGHDERKIGFDERQSVRRIGHRQDTDHPVLKPYRRGDDGFYGERRVVVLHDARVGHGIGDQLADARARHLADDALVDVKYLRLQHLLDEARPGGELGLGLRRQWPVRREQPFHGHPLHLVVGALLEDAGAQRARAKDGGMHNALKQVVARKALPKRLDHVMHEIHHQLLLLRQHQLLLLQPVRLGTGFRTEPEQGQRAGRGTQEKEEHGGILEAAAAGSRQKVRRQARR